MRKRLMLFLVLCFVVLFAPTAIAQTWYTANQATVAWDAVAPIAAGDTIKYQIYIRTGTTGDGTAVGAEVTTTQTTVTFSAEGRYFLGVKTIRYPQGETVGIPSTNTAWSNVAGDCSAAGPFGIKYFVAPGSAGGLRRVP